MTSSSAEPDPASAPHTGEEKAAIWIHGQTPLGGTIALADYDPAWPAHYESHRQRIAAALGNRIVMLEHVGSTSVPGLAAKPRIDILLVVADSADEPSYVPLLETAGMPCTSASATGTSTACYAGPNQMRMCTSFHPAAPRSNACSVSATGFAPTRTIAGSTNRTSARLLPNSGPTSRTTPTPKPPSSKTSSGVPVCQHPSTRRPSGPVLEQRYSSVSTTICTGFGPRPIA